MVTTQQPVGETLRLFSLQNRKIIDALPEGGFDRITTLVERVFDVPSARVNLVDDTVQWLKRHAVAESSDAHATAPLCANAVRKNTAVVVDDVCRDPQFSGQTMRVNGVEVRAYAGIPVHSPDGAAVGTLSIVDGQPRQFSTDQIETLQSFAEMVDRELALLAQTTSDELTRLANRRGFVQTADHMLALCKRHGKPAAVIGIDLDNFKMINDTQGHDAGDWVLERFAALLVKNFRASDIVARFGGDEFCVLSSYTSRADIRASLERLAEMFEISELKSEFPQLAWSAGIAEFDPATEPVLEPLLQQADARMYAAKQSKQRG